VVVVRGLQFQDQLLFLELIPLVVVEEELGLQVVEVVLVVPVSSSSPTLHKYIKNHNGISW
jgi:hypothetical protein